MADEADIAQERMEREEALNRPRPYHLNFQQGDCMDCGEQSTLVDSLCCQCRADAERRARG